MNFGLGMGINWDLSRMGMKQELMIVNDQEFYLFGNNKNYMIGNLKYNPHFI